MSTLEVTKSNALKAFKQADSKGKEMLKNLLGESNFSEKLSDRIKTMDDVYSELEIDKAAFEKGFLFKEDLDAAKIRLIVKLFNEGWEPDWTNKNQTKYVPWFDLSSGVGFSHSDYDCWSATTVVGSRLCLKSKELALELPITFKTEFENYIIIKK